MGSYRVYKVGEEEHVREVVVATPPPLDRGGHARGRGRGRGRATARRRRWVLVLLVAAFVAAAVLYWLYGREAVGNSRAALDLAKLSGKVPGWAVVGAPVVMVLAIAFVTAYLAFGRNLAVKLIGVIVVVIVLATPGLAVGYANGLVADVGQTGSAARTSKDKQDIAAADKEVDRPIPNKPMNILLIGSDQSNLPGDPGRSDTQLLVRLDPETKSISMLSLPRDLQVDIPGVGLAKMNEAYSYGGPALVIKTFKQLTGLPVNGWIEVNFAGFWHVVNILGASISPSTTSTSCRPAPTTSRSTSRPGISWSAASRRSTSCASATTNRETSRACSGSSCSSRSCSVNPAAGAGTGRRSSS